MNATQCNRILRLLTSRNGGWVPLYEIMALGIASHTRRIFELRQSGHKIEKDEDRIGVQRHVKYRLVLSLVTLLLLAPVTHADIITQDVSTILTENAAIPMDSGIADMLAANIMVAQEDSGYGSLLSLEDSIVSVERAITISANLFGDTTLTAANDWLPIAQSEIAINPNAGFCLTLNGSECLPPGSVINFGTVILDEQAVATPEPETQWLVGLEFLVVGLGCSIAGFKKIWKQTR